jgi:Ca-activated chloride channel family protein
MLKTIILFVLVLLFTAAAFAQQPAGTEGNLFARDQQGALGFCPLKSTKVRADISGFFARVTVLQEFENTFGDPIEAVYTFPLSQNSAVDRMTMTIGERVIRGKIMKREEAKRVYDAAKAAGQAAALLDQQRPNIFTQSVANIMPGEKVLVEISYVETLKYDEGSYEFVFPMVVGPRYIPASVPAGDARRISAPMSAQRAGHDISIDINLDAGVPIEDVRSISHEIETVPFGAETRKIALKDLNAIPNKDFVLRYDVTGKRLQDGILMHRSAKGGFFTMMIQPPESFAAKDVNPKEIVFVLDTSGSMSGFPIEKAKEAMNLALDGLYPRDTFNLITFAGDTRILFEKPVPATDFNLNLAREFLNSSKGRGGTEMMKAVTAALEPSGSQRHVRIACFMTDGYVGNEAEIIAEIQKYSNARVFSFGIGNSVNRYLLDKMAQEGRGEVEYVSLKDDGSKAAKRFHERVRNPLLTDISIDWGEMAVSDVYPGKQPDLFSAKPVALTGRFAKSGSGSVTLRGKMAGRDYTREIPLIFPEAEAANDALATVWARTRVDELMSKYYGAKEPDRKAIENEITQLGLEFGLMTQFTSFVAVEERVVNQDGKQVRIEVPVEGPAGTVYSAVGDLTAAVTVTAGATVNVTSTQFSSNLPTGRSVQGLYTIAPTVARAGLRDAPARDRSPAVAGSSGPENSYIVDGTSTLSTVQKAAAPAPSWPGIGSVLKRMDTHQLALKTLRSDIKISTFDAGLNKSADRRGQLLYQSIKTNPSVRVDLEEPKESISVINGNYSIYFPELRQYRTGKPRDAAMVRGLAFLNIPATELKANYTVEYIGGEDVSPGIRSWHLELKPKNAAEFKSVHLWINSEGLPVQLRFVEQDDDIMTLLITNPEKNIVLKPEDFQIEIPEDTKPMPDEVPVTP